MKSIRPVHTQRISVALRELEMGQVQELCKIPAHFDQRTVTEFLRSIITPIPRQAGEPAVDDPLYWSVNERMHVTTYYMADMLDDGPNFALGDLRLADYLLDDTDYVSEVEFTFEGEALVFSPLLGYQAEAIESLIVGGRFESTFLNWNAGYMAACMRGAGEEPAPYSHPEQYQDVLASKMQNILRIPESRCSRLYDSFAEAALRAQHFVHAVVTAYGVVALQITDPVPGATGEVAQRATARFRPRSAISQGTRNLVAFPDGAAL